jgi:hypothetical protein
LDGGDSLNKKVLAIAVFLLSVALVAIPLVQAYGFWRFDKRTKSDIALVYYDLTQVGDPEIKEFNGLTVKIADFTADVLVGGGAVAAGLIPAINPSGNFPENSYAAGKYELKVTKVYDPETGLEQLKLREPCILMALRRL